VYCCWPSARKSFYARSARHEGAILKAEELLASTPNSYMLQQFDNAANPRSTSRPRPEIWNDTTDGRLSGLRHCTGGPSLALPIHQAKKASFKAIAVEPTESPVLSEESRAAQDSRDRRRLCSSILRRDYIDEVIQVSNDDAIRTARRLPLEEGIFVGISSGAGLRRSASGAASRECGKLIVAILPSSESAT